MGKLAAIKMKKILGIFVLGLLFFSNVNAEERENELGNLFKQLKNSQATQAIKVENKIWKIWTTHPANDRKGFRLTELLDQGSLLIDRGQLKKAYKIFTQIIIADPKWSEAWNKRATVLYLMKKYQFSLDDINVTLTLEPRHFGALSGQALNYIELTQYEKAIESYKAAQKIYPAMGAAKKMIPKLKELIDDQTV
jgi:tetratricopeptide (TPR) repeat protein